MNLLNFILLNFQIFIFKPLKLILHSKNGPQIREPEILNPFSESQPSQTSLAIPQPKKKGKIEERRKALFYGDIKTIIDILNIAVNLLLRYCVFIYLKIYCNI